MIIRPISRRDAPMLYPLINDPGIAANMLSLPHPYPANVLVPWILKCRESMEKRERFELTMVLKETGQAIGVCSLSRISWEHMNAELGYWLGRPYWGKGYMTEAVTRLVSAGFEVLGLERIYARCFATNPASARVLEKAGLKFEGKGRHEIKKDDRFIDMLHFGLIRADWAVKNHLVL
ncbi:MAG TPA: GNAT family N-acetyltransferase [Armatimonadota bacterium]|nr:GNAT family N-acetyltransferase [Armatimonadota bacterium]